ncbi:MAG: response regulator transcription factor [Chitinophagales bacterium]|nr:response regulator transcription factor [Chitinophagales bacterium]MDW8428415.1 response regulator transcription factor [Chitinophagales bacterium]
MQASTHSPAAKILIVDDEVDVLEFIEYSLRKEGYEVYAARDGLEAIRLAREVHPDLVLLDVMMPNLDGLATAEHLRSLRELRQVLIVFLTARNDEQSELAGFHAGADDYITKPIKPRLLVSRLKALLRRRTAGDVMDQISIGHVTIDRERRIVRVNDQEVFLARKEFDLLAMLASKPGRVFPRAEILKRIWGDEVIVGDRTIDVHVRKIRQKVGESLIKTVKGVGYKFEI